MKIACFMSKEMQTDILCWMLYTTNNILLKLEFLYNSLQCSISGMRYLDLPGYYVQDHHSMLLMWKTAAQAFSRKESGIRSSLEQEMKTELGIKEQRKIRRVVDAIWQQNNKYDWSWILPMRYSNAQKSISFTLANWNYNTTINTSSSQWFCDI